MHTSLLLVALMGPGAAPETKVSEALSWQASYQTARNAGRSAKKPLAVFVGSGSKGWEKVTEEGGLTRRARQLLSEQYVCVYADVATTEGKNLAKALDITSGSGLIISTRNGEDQAFAHDGKLTRGELEESLQKFTGVTDIRRTESLARVRYTNVNYPDGSMRPVSGTIATSTTQNGIVPAGYAVPQQGSYVPTIQHAYQPSMSYGGYAAPASYGSYGGGFSGGFSSGGGC